MTDTLGDVPMYDDNGNQVVASTELDGQAAQGDLTQASAAAENTSNYPTDFDNTPFDISGSSNPSDPTAFSSHAAQTTTDENLMQQTHTDGATNIKDSIQAGATGMTDDKDGGIQYNFGATGDGDGEFDFETFQDDENPITEDAMDEGTGEEQIQEEDGEVCARPSAHLISMLIRSDTVAPLSHG